MNADALQTGDLLLVCGSPPPTSVFHWLLDSAVSFFTHSAYTHAGMVVRDPTFASVPRGLYVWESCWENETDPETGRYRMGVRLTHLNTFVKASEGPIYVRQRTNGVLDESILAEIHEVVKNKPYDVDPFDWLLAILRKDSDPQKTSRFWCSAFVAYVLVRVGWLAKEVDWSIVRPCDLASTGTYLKWTQDVYGQECMLQEPCLKS